METKEILDTNVAINKKQGAITVFTAIEHPPCNNKAFEILFPEMEDYIKAISIAYSLRKNGTPIGAIDIIISAMCLNRNKTLLTKDKDFKNVEKIFPEFKLNIE